MRWLGLLSAAAIGVHELRYFAAPGAHAPRCLLRAGPCLPAARRCAGPAAVRGVGCPVRVVPGGGPQRRDARRPRPLRFRSGLDRGHRCPARDLRHPGVARGSAARRPSGWAARPLRSRRLVRLRLRASARRRWWRFSCAVRRGRSSSPPSQGSGARAAGRSAPSRCGRRSAGRCVSARLPATSRAGRLPSRPPSEEAAPRAALGVAAVPVATSMSSPLRDRRGGSMLVSEKEVQMGREGLVVTT